MQARIVIYIYHPIIVLTRETYGKEDGPNCIEGEVLSADHHATLLHPPPLTLVSMAKIRRRTNTRWLTIENKIMH